MKNKKGSLEISINTIVIVVIGTTLLTLGLVFVKNMFTEESETIYVNLSDRNNENCWDNLNCSIEDDNNSIDSECWYTIDDSKNISCSDVDDNISFSEDNLTISFLSPKNPVSINMLVHTDEVMNLKDYIYSNKDKDIKLLNEFRGYNYCFVFDENGKLFSEKEGVICVDNLMVKGMDYADCRTQKEKLNPVLFNEKGEPIGYEKIWVDDTTNCKPIFYTYVFCDREIDCEEFKQ